MDEKLIASGGAIKAIPGSQAGRIGGYLLVWSNPQETDLHGEYFTPDTELELDGVPAIKALFHHGLDATLKAKPIGVIDTFKKDNVGLWVEGVLDLHDEYVAAIYDLIQRGVLGWSSGSMPHQAKTAGDGRITYWPVYEASATPSPAEWRNATQVMTLKSFLASTQDVNLKPKEQTAKEGTAAPKTDSKTISPNFEDQTNKLFFTKGILEMSLLDMIKEFLAALIAEGVQIPQDQIDALAQQIAGQIAPETAAEPAPDVAKIQPQIMKAVADFIANRNVANANAVKNAAIEAAKTMRQTPAVNLPAFTGAANANGNGNQFPRIEMRTKYADMSAEDMSYYLQVRNAMRRKDNLPALAIDSAFVRELADKAGKAYEKGAIKFGGKEETDRAVKSINFLKANEVNHSTQSGYGDEWVPDLWSNQLWEKARLDNVILPLFKVVEMPSNPYELPVQSTDPSVYFVPETTAESELLISGSGNPIPDSKLATAKATLTAKKLALRVGFSAELDEDSIIPWVAEARKDAIRAMEDAVDNVLLNGDTETGATGNVNLVDSTPAATAKYLAMNGLRKLWLVTTTANSVDGGGAAISLAQIRAARFSLDAAFSARVADLAIVTHSEQYAKLLGLTEFLTRDVAGDLATNLTGMIGMIDGIPVVVSKEYAKANTAGKISNTGGNNTLGSLTIVHRPSWVVGFRRKINAVMEYWAATDSYQLTATVRLAFINHNADCAAGVYNSLV